MHAREVILIDVAEDPNIREIGNGEGVAAGEGLDPGSIRDLLIGDNSGNRGLDVHNRPRVILVDPEDMEALGGGFDINLGLVEGVLRHLEIVKGDGALVIQDLRTLKLLLRQKFVRHRLAIIGKRGRNIGALHP